MSPEEERITYAIDCLKSALLNLKTANAPRTTEKVRLAISSAKGALRNAGYKATSAHLKAGG